MSAPTPRSGPAASSDGPAPAGQGVAGGADGADPAAQDAAGRHGPWLSLRRGRVIAGLALLLALLIAGHRAVPDVLTVGTLLDSALPWLGLFVVPLLIAALLRRSLLALTALLVPALVWSVLFLPAVLRSPSGGPSNLRVAEQNFYAGNGSPAVLASSLARTDADLIGVEEVTAAGADALETALTPQYPYVIRVSTLELWSKYPLGTWTPVDVGLAWTRALHTTVTTPHGPVSVYLAHLDSFRLDSDATRDVGLADLGAAVRADPNRRILLLGDLNTASTDRHFSALSPLGDVQQHAAGLGFTWPSPLPLVRPDHIMVRGIGVADASTVTGSGSDHRGTVAELEVGS